MKDRVPVNSLILDGEIYPRSSVDSQHVGYLLEAMNGGATLPPVVADKKTRKVIDGFHRCKAHLRRDGELAEIDVVWKSYPNEKEAFLDAVRANAHHGARLDTHDRVHCGIRAKELRIKQADIADALNMTVDRWKKLFEGRTATRAARGPNGGAAVALKHTIKHKAGKTLTKAQVEANDRLGGMSQTFFVNQVLLLLANDLVNEDDPEMRPALMRLRAAIDDYLGE